MSISGPDARGWRGVIRKYRKHLPVTDDTPVISLHEGNTPLIRVPNFVKTIGGSFELYLKCEGLNPTASFKDRGMTVAVSMAAARGAQIIMCASTGNTSASAAAYSARAGLKCVVLLPEGKIAYGKLAQALMYGAQTLSVEGNFDEALEIVRELGEANEVEVVNSINPNRLEGQKTAAFEICDALGDAPDFHFLPVGNAGNITAYWKGYTEYQDAGEADTHPRMMGWQAAGAAPIGKLEKRKGSGEGFWWAYRQGDRRRDCCRLSNACKERRDFCGAGFGGCLGRCDSQSKRRSHSRW